MEQAHSKCACLSRAPRSSNESIPRATLRKTEAFQRGELVDTRDHDDCTAKQGCNFCRQCDMGESEQSDIGGQPCERPYQQIGSSEDPSRSECVIERALDCLHSM